jgi:acetyl esterase/lipase
MKNARFIFISLFILFVLNTSSSWSQEIRFTSTEDVVYGRKDGMALTMDIFRPGKPNGIGVILLVSGGWSSSHNRIETEWKERIKKLIEVGETVFAVVHSSIPKYRIPDIQKDIIRAVRFIKFHAKELNVDPDRLGIIGHSSGAHLSLLHAATAPNEDPNAKDPIDRLNAKVQAVACFYPPTDFLFFGAKGFNALANPKFKKFLPAFVNDVNDTTALVKVAGELSPIKYVTSSMPPTLIISGTADQLVPFQQSQLFIDRLKELNIPCRLEVREGKDHGWLRIEDDYKLVAEWFEQYLKK